MLALGGGDPWGSLDISGAELCPVSPLLEREKMLWHEGNGGGMWTQRCGEQHESPCGIWVVLSLLVSPHISFFSLFPPSGQDKIYSFLSWGHLCEVTLRPACLR